MGIFRFTIQRKETGEQRQIERPLFPFDDRQKLNEFCDCADALNQTSFVKNWANNRLSIHFTNDGQIKNVGTLPSEDEIAAFLHRLRPIYLNDERTNFDRITNLACRHLDDEDITKCIRYWKKFYDGRDSQEMFSISVGGKTVNSKGYFDHYVNAFEYHRDSARRQHIDEITKHFPLEAQKPVFVLLLGMRMNAINKFTSFLRTCFEREDGRPITVLIP